MKKITLLFALFISIKSFSQDSESIYLSKINFCELSIDDLKNQDANLKEVKLEEMEFCTDGFREDNRYVNRTGYESKLYPGVIFQKYRADNNIVAKIHLTKEFKGYLPDGNYVDLRVLKAKDILTKYDSLDSWTSRGCSDYWGINRNNKLKFYVKIIKDKEPRYPIDEKFYSEQSIDGIDIITDCSYFEKIANSPLYIINGKETTEKVIQGLKAEDVETVTVLKDKNAVEKYGEKGKNGVIEIKLKGK